MEIIGGELSHLTIKNSLFFATDKKLSPNLQEKLFYDFKEKLWQNFRINQDINTKLNVDQISWKK